MTQKSPLEQIEEALNDGHHDAIAQLILNTAGSFIPGLSGIAASTAQIEQHKINKIIEEALKLDDSRLKQLEACIIDQELKRPVYSEFTFNQATSEIISGDWRVADSLTDNGTGDFTINLMDAADNYVVINTSSKKVSYSKSGAGIHLKLEQGCPEVVSVTIMAKPFADVCS